MSGYSKLAKLKVPHTFALLFFLIVITAIATHFVPAGVYDRITDPNTGRTLVNPTTFHYVAASPVGAFQTFIDVYKGLVDAADIIFFIMISYACFFLIIQAGALNAAIGALLRHTRGKEVFIVPIFIYVFATCSAFFGMF